MSGLTGVTGASRPHGIEAKGGVRATTARPSPDLMPEPGAPTESGYADAMSELYSLMSALDAASAGGAQASVQNQTNAKKTALKKEEDAREAQRKKEEDAKNDSGGFWGSLGSIAGTIADAACVVGSVALAVVSCGLAAPVVLAAVSVTNFALKETHAYEKMGDFGKFIECGVALGTGICGGLLAGGTALTSGIEAGGAVAGGTAGVANGVVAKEVADDQADADEHAADATQAQHEVEKKQRMIEDVIEALKETHASCQHAMTSLEDAMQTQGQTLVAISSVTGRA